MDHSPFVPRMDHRTLKGKFTPYCFSHVLRPRRLTQSVVIALEFFSAILIIIPNFTNVTSKYFSRFSYHAVYDSNGK
jgi:hypothetical protein